MGMIGPVPSFDVLVIGSGASGLAAAVSARRAGARVAVATKGALQSCNSAKAQGGIQAAFGEDELDAAAVVLAAGGRCYREAEERGELSTNHPGATGEVTRIALDLGAEARDLDALQYHPNGGAWPENMQGYSIPETTRAYGAVLLNANSEEFTDSLGAPGGVARHDPDLGGGRRGLPPVHAASLPGGGHRPARGADPDLPRAPLPERRAPRGRARADDRRGPLPPRRDRRRGAR